MTKDLEYYVANLESMAKGLECDIEFNWPGKDPATLDPQCSCGAREEPNVGTARNRIQFFRELAEILQAAMPKENNNPDCLHEFADNDGNGMKCVHCGVFLENLVGKSNEEDGNWPDGAT